jgi:hypothetical protein
MSRTAELTPQTYPISTSYPHAITGHRQRASLALLLIAAVFCMLYAPPPARADWYLFSRFNAIGGSQQNSLYGAAINASGQLVFYQSSDESIYKADLVTHEKIVTTKLYSPSSPFVSLGASPRINDLGDVGFVASRHNGHSEVVRYTAATQGLTTIAEGDAFDSNATYADVSGSSINNAGAVAFRGVAHNAHQEVRVGIGGNPVYIDGSSASEIKYFEEPVLQTAGTTLQLTWSYADGFPPNGTSYIKKGNTLNHTTIAQSGGFFELLETPSISNAGDVAYKKKNYSTNNEAIFVGNGGVPNMVADTSGEFSWFYARPAISNAGVAFKAEFDSSGHGIFTGPNPLSDKVLATGDTIPDWASTVEDVALSQEGMNDSGQIAMWVRFEDGTNCVYRADPYILPQVFEKGIAIATLKAEQSASMSQRVSMPSGDETLSFDYHFPTTTGQLTVTLEGEVLAQFDAPDVLTDGFTTFETLVDIGALFPDPVEELLLEFSLTGTSDIAGLMLDDIGFRGLENGDFATGNLAGWESTFAEGDGVGVAVNPFYRPAPAVPEPSAILLALVGLLLLPRRRGR